MNLKDKIASISIHTVPIADSYDDLSDVGKDAWASENTSLDVTPTYEELKTLWSNRASVHAEFSKIISVGIAYENGGVIKCKTLSSKDELEILSEVGPIINSFSNKGYTFAAHSGKYFTFPFIAKRFMINRIDVPACLDGSLKKPWEVDLIDINTLWRFGGTGPGASLEALSFSLGMNVPKDYISGSEVMSAYLAGNIEAIDKSVRHNAVQSMNIIRLFRGQDVIEEVDNGSPEIQEENIFIKIFNSNRFPTKKLEKIVKEVGHTDGLQELIEAAYIKKTDKAAKRKEKIKKIEDFIEKMN